MPRLLLLSLALVLAACKGNSPTEPHFPDATLTGVVTFVESGAPVADATVSVRMATETAFIQARTDAQGRYTLMALPGTYTVRVFAPGASSPAFLDLIDIGGTATRNFAISSAGCAIMSGRIIDQVSRAAIAGATITFFGQTAVSDAGGSYALHLGCPPRPHPVSEVITVDHPRYVRREFLISVPTYSTVADIFLQPN